MTLNELREKLGNTFTVRHTRTGETLQISFLFSNIYGAKGEDGLTRFASGLPDVYEQVKGETMISPEEQKAAREKERQRNNAKVVKDLRMQDAFKEVIAKRTTKKRPAFTVIKGGKDDE